MKKLLHKLVVLWTNLLGLARAKSNKVVTEEKNKIARQRVILLDEFEISSYHSN